MWTPRKRSQPIANFAFLFLACLLLCEMASGTPYITLSKKSGPPTSGILVSGRGFEPNVGVDIYFDTKDEALVITNGKGAFHDAGIHAPRGAYPGKHWVTALERNNDKGAQEPFLVQTNWSQFHFDADGTRLNPYENVLNPRTTRDLDLKWSYLTPASVFSSPAVTNGVVYVSSEDGSVFALNARTGATLWSYSTGAYVGSVAVANGAVYFSTFNGKVYALNARTGATLWSKSNSNYTDADVTIANGVVYVGSLGGAIYALNARTGKTLWSYITGSYVFSAPAVVNGVVYVGSNDHNVYALDARTGGRLWSYTTGLWVNSAPAVVNGVVYVGSDDYNVYALNAISGFKLWSYTTGSYVDSSPAVADGVVYVSSGDGNLYALSADTGNAIWSYTIGIANEEGSSAAVANGVVYVGSYSGANMDALDARTGTLLWSHPFVNSVTSSPAVVNGVLYVGCWDDSVYAFGLSGGDDSRQEAASKRPSFKILRPDFNLKASE
ncbi:MAG TPA: PQQ-binding-like beta-propeller repeat protein [Terriglobales bacterium]|nr:PQQ-binding-like beta-propeller repeat protein [Terriglobales bacterium]